MTRLSLLSPETPSIREIMSDFLLRRKFLSTCELIVRKDVLLQWHTWLARGTFFLCMGIFHAFFTRSYLEPTRYEFYTFLKLTPKSIVLLFGLWLSTTKFGSRRRILTSILLLPSLGFIVFVADYLGAAAGLLSTVVILWSYWIVINRGRIAK
jgi:hypothetical protein